MHTLVQALAASLVLLQVQHLGEIRIGQPFPLLLQIHACFAQILTPRLQRLWKPLPALGTLEGSRNHVRMLQDFADILPHQGIKLFSRDIARRTLLIATGNDRLALPMTDVVGIPSSAAAANTSQATQTTTDQGP